MSDKIITDETEKGRKFIAIATLLGGDRMVTGLNRLMDGLCPDCGQPEDTHEETRCHNFVPDDETK